MSDYIVSARKYRPQNWHTVVGQKGLVQTLKNAIVGGKLAHAYLFCGPRGVGKTTCARIFAKTINCMHLGPDGEACNECESCQSFNEQRSYNVYELDGASNNSVDNIRDLIEQVIIPPQIGKYKVFIIDEVHMLSTSAFNAFLKTLEEPPKHAIFVMATTEKQKILPTILSRCQTYDFQRISLQDIVEQLQYIAQSEGISAEPQALQVIARKADGGMRDALSLFDQITSFTGGQVSYQSTIQNLNILDYEVFFRLTDAALQGNIPAALLMLDDAIRHGFDPQYFIGGFASHLRDLMVSQDPNTLSLIEAGPEVAQRYQRQAAQCHPSFLYGALPIVADCDFNYRNSRNKRLSVELALVKICQLLHPVAQGGQTAPMTGAAQVAPGAGVAPGARVAPAAQGAYGAPGAGVASGAGVSSAAQVVPGAASRPAGQAQPMARPTQPTLGGVPSGQSPQPVRPQAANLPLKGAGGSPNLPLNGPGGSPMPRILSLKGGVTQPQAAAAAAPQELPEMNEPVSDDALRRAWKEFAATVPTEKLLVNTMKACLLSQVSETQYRGTVESDTQRNILEQHSAKMLYFLRSKLRNTHLQIDFIVDRSDVTVRRAYSPREKFVEMQQSNPVLNELVEAFGLEFV